MPQEIWPLSKAAPASQNAMNAGYITAMQTEEEAIEGFKDFDPWKRLPSPASKEEGGSILAGVG